ERLGIDRASPLRARAALKFVLQTLSDEGHCGFPEEGVIERTIALTGIERAIVAQAAEQQCQIGDVVREPWKLADSSEQSAVPWLYLKPLYLAEQGVARAVLALAKGPHPLPTTDVDTALAWVEK